MKKAVPLLTLDAHDPDALPDDVVDVLFGALADATRRDILRRSADGGISVTGLAAEYPMSFAAVQKHVAVLERAGLVTKERRGREALVRTDADAVRRARLALDHLEATWLGRVERMTGLLAEPTGLAERSPDTEGDER